MKILIGLSYYLPNLSGLTMCAKNLADGLVQNGHEVEIVTSQHKKSLPFYEKHGGLRVKRIPISFFVGKGPIMLDYPFRVFNSIKKADVINCHLPQFESFILVIAAKLLQKKVVLTYQCDLAWKSGVYNRIISISLFFSHLLSAIFADIIVSSTEDYAKHSFFLSLFPKKLTYIYPPVLPTRKWEKGKKSINIESYGKTKYIIGMVGRISQEKGIEFLIRTIPFLKKSLSNDFVILLAGPRNPIGEEKYLSTIKQFFKKYRRNFFYLDTLSEDGLDEFYSLIDVLVLPSINSAEAFGMVQIEAMMAGIPVIASNMPGVRVPVKLTGMGEIFEKANTQDLAAKIIRVIINKNKYVKTSKIIQEIFGYKKIIQNYEEILRKY